MTAVTNTNIKMALSGFLVLAMGTIMVFRGRCKTLPPPRSKAWGEITIILVGTLLFFSALLAALGIRHYALTDYSVEWDFPGYMLRSQTWRSVFSANDRTPFGYPLLLWLITHLSGDAFVSGKVIAGVSSITALGVTYLLAKRLFEPQTALLCAMALPVISLFTGHAMLVGTDMPALALLLISLYLLAAALGSDLAGMVLAGAFGGLSYLVRPSGIVLVPAIVAWIGIQSDLDTHGRRKAVFAYALSFLLVITPQLIISWAQTGSPFYNSRAKDVWMDIYGNWDWALWPTIGEISVMDVILMDPVRFLVNWAGNLVETVRHSPIDWPLAWFTILGFLALPFTGPKREVGLIYWFCGAYLALVSIAWSTLSQSRIFLMIVPFALMVAVWLFRYLVPSDLRVAQQKIPCQEPLFLLVLLLMLWNGDPYILFLNPGVERHHSFMKPEVQTPLRANLDNKALLIGYRADKREFRPRDTLYLTLYWQAQYVGSKNYSVFIHLVGEDSHIWAQDDSWPGKGEHPTSLWLAGEFIQDPHELVVPPDAPAGPYEVVVGMYLWDTGERRNVIDEDGQPQGNAIILEPFQVISP